MLNVDLEEEVEEVAPLRVKDLPLIKTEEPEKYYEFLGKFLKGTKGSLGVIWNSFEGLESPALTKLSQEFSIPMFPIGPFHNYFPSSASYSSFISQDQSCITWLDTKPPNSVVYVSFGSLAAITETEFLEIAWGWPIASTHFYGWFDRGLSRTRNGWSHCQVGSWRIWKGEA